MAEINTKDNQLLENKETNKRWDGRDPNDDEESDAESLDSEGYSKNDPYADAAKRIDKQNKAKDELK